MSSFCVTMPVALSLRAWLAVWNNRAKPILRPPGLAVVFGLWAHEMSPARGGRYGSSGDPSETEIWSLPQSDDPNVIAEELSNHFRERIRYFAVRRLSDRDAAEDVAQDVLRRVLEALQAGRIENPQALPAFLFQTARNVCMQWSRSESRKVRAFLRLKTEEDDPGEDPLADLITDERRQEVRDAFGQLGPGDREVLRLSFAEALGADEIAERLSSTAGAVRVRRHRALNRLAILLGVTDRSHREL